MQRLSNSIQPRVYDIVPGADGYRAFSIDETVGALQRELGAREISLHYITTGHFFPGTEEFEALTARLTDCTDAQRGALRNLLYGDFVVLHIS